MRKITKLQNAMFAKTGEAFIPVKLPHSWNALDGQDGGNDYHRGLCTYQIGLPVPTPGKRQYIEFRGANHIAHVFCNGTLLGEHRGGFSTFRYELTPYMNSGENTLTVTVTNEVCQVYPQQADFTFFGGLYRDVSYIETEQAHFDLLKDGSQGLFITPYASGRTRFDCFTVDAADCTLEVTLLAEGEEVASWSDAAQLHTSGYLKVENPRLWQGRQDPFCYEARASLYRNGVLQDQVTVTCGYRSFHVDPDRGFFLNGESTPLHGVCRHQDRMDKGWALSPEDHAEDMDLICELGANTIRLAHYQHDQYFYDLCDQKGMVVWAEIPFISRFMPGQEARDNTLSQMRELIAQNYNHPSICFWGISNEITIGGYTEPLLRNLHDLNALCKTMDPSRLTTMAQIASVPMDSEHNYITDVVSYNYYYGWYAKEIADNGPTFDKFHQLNPDRPYGISEYGADNLMCWHSAAPFNHDYTEEYACHYHQEMLKTFAARPFLWATHMWNMFDFAVDARDEGGIKGRNTKGLVSFDRKTRKDSYYVYKAWWTQEPMVRLAGRRFADRAPGERDVTVYTNCPQVTLYLNGQRLQTLPAEDHMVVFRDVPLADGENTLLAQAEGAEDQISLFGVAVHNAAYDLPDIEAALQAGNWFESQNEDSGEAVENSYNVDVPVGELLENDQCMRMVRGWIMSNNRIQHAPKMNMVSRLTNWKAMWGDRSLRELSVIAKNMQEEDFALIDKMLRRIPRESKAE